MELVQLYRQFNKAQRDRLGKNRFSERSLDNPPPVPVLKSWAESSPDDHDEEDNPRVCRRLFIAANCILIAKEQGMSAAVLWKLQNG